MSLRIGELARQSGLSVRALRHYDTIGLLSPSARTESGYRLYGREDVMRLHAIQALKGFGCSLAEIRQALRRGEPALPEILARQVEALDLQARRAEALRDRLLRLRERMLGNEAPTVGEWLQALGMMHLYRRYFSEAELSRLRRGWNRRGWECLADRVRQAVAAGLAPESPEALGLAREVAVEARRRTGGDPVLLLKLRVVMRREERIRAVAGLGEEELDWLDVALKALPREAPASAPSGTALGVAMLRAAHQLLDDPPVLVDPFALSLVGPACEAAIRNDPARFEAGELRGLRASVAVRGRLAEDAWARARERGVSQCVFLGAGFETFAYRTPDRESRIFEVDHPGTQAEKRRRLAAAGLDAPDNLVFVPLDFTRQSLAEALVAAGLRRELPAFFSWLGVTMYLPEATVLETLAVLAGMAPGSEVVFNYAVDPQSLSPAQRRGCEAVRARAEAKGEPWLSCFDPVGLAGQLAAMGFVIIEDLDGAAQTARYLAGRGDGLKISGGSRIMRLVVDRVS